MAVVSGSLGLFFGVSAFKSTGASRKSNFAHEPRLIETTFYHFCPQFTPKPFIVNNKVASDHNETRPKEETTINCGFENS